MSRTPKLVVNALLFQVAWFACVLGASQPWLLVVAAACVAVHLLWVSEPAREWRVLALVAACGWLTDTLLLRAGVFQFVESTWRLPLWLALLWLAFATTLGYSLQWTSQRWWLASALGAIGGPLSYLGGAQLAPVQLPLGTLPSVLILAAVWAVLLPTLHRLAARVSA